MASTEEPNDGFLKPAVREMRSPTALARPPNSVDRSDPPTPDPREEGVKPRAISSGLAVTLESLLELVMGSKIRRIAPVSEVLLTRPPSTAAKLLWSPRDTAVSDSPRRWASPPTAGAARM